MRNSNPSDSDSRSSGSSSEDDDDEDEMILEGVLRRNPEVPSSSDDEDSNPNDNDDDDEDGKGNKHKLPQTQNSTTSTNIKKLKKDSKNKKDPKQGIDRSDDDLVHVEFTFHDMDEKFWHGLKMLLLSVPVFAPISSALADELIENISVGTVVSCDDGGDNVYGFASVLPIQPFSEDDPTALQHLIQRCMDECPDQHKAEMTFVTSGSTQRPAGIFIHGRMVNLPLDITLILHEQLVLDMDWAVDHAEGGEAERKLLDFGALILLAPCYVDAITQKNTYKNFDDELFASHAEFVYPIHTTHPMSKSLKKRSSQTNDHEGITHVIVLTKTGHRQAMKELKELVNGSKL
jgi:hypothetical protein